MSKPEILVIDDEAEIRTLLEITLRNNDYKVVTAASAREGMLLAAHHPPDLILLDLGLPDENGQEVLKKLRTWFNKPIIILSVHDDEKNIVAALDNDASDYLTKPFRTSELLARVRMLLRNVNRAEIEKEIVSGDVEINLVARLVKKNGETVKLTATEFNLLALLARHEGRVLTHTFLINEVWGPGHPEQAQTLRVFIGQLRKKIENDQNDPEYILTEPRVGYRFRIKE